MPAQPQPDREPAQLHHRAADNLSFIRNTMERASAFTAVPGWGGVVMGTTALAAAWIAHRQPSQDRWLLVWLAEGWLACALGTAAMVRKAAGANVSLGGTQGRRFLLAFLPAIGAGGLLTLMLYRNGRPDLLPATWLACYGAAVTAGGAHSVRPIPLLGGGFLLLGAVAALAPASWGDVLLALGFGGLQIGFGAWIGRRHGG